MTDPVIIDKRRVHAGQRAYVHIQGKVVDLKDGELNDYLAIRVKLPSGVPAYYLVIKGLNIQLEEFMGEITEVIGAVVDVKFDDEFYMSYIPVIQPFQITRITHRNDFDDEEEEDRENE